MAKTKDYLSTTIKKRLVSSLNKGLIPMEYSLHALKKALKNIKKTAPLVYDEVEALIKSNIVHIDKRKKIFKKPDLVDLGDTITSSLIQKIPALNERELKKIVGSKSSQTFIDMLAKGLSVSSFNEKEYTLLAKEKKFNKVLIANRGEIALRVIRACRELGIETVLVYSRQDKETLAAKFADKACYIGPGASYLDINKIINIAIKTKADAIHPGYGFLAENVKFARLCEKNKIKFIGPSSKTIGLLGDKVRAKKSVLKAKVPVIVGVVKTLKNKKHAIKVAAKLGFPIIVKAASGGGGKGMRIVRNIGELEKSFDSAEAEAYLSFGDKTLYIEKYIEDPRHIEFQILADQYGNVVHLGERDCSIQRKHQKLVEESPSPALNDELREKMGDAAVKAVAAARYEGAGTVEFLLDKNKNFYFIEMNTRIQVEHGVTEMVTGVDLVKEQIKLAAGAKLAFNQDNINLDGSAIECRINAEDPLNNFHPSIGTVINYLPPGGPGIRVNSICHQGYKVLPDYDSLLSLLICHGRNRDEAITRMKGALKEYLIDGIKTTIPFHLAVMHNKNFIKGKVTTSFIEKNDILKYTKKYSLEKKKELTNGQKIILVTTSVSKYMEKKNGYNNNKPNAWVMAGRQELMENSEV
jgi:acetyl-CoA carboxylase biotin carboxylase subunit|tara:strand:- start:1964 stop:3880 length:1917 start_codon:yes stop_codon:yes gene_type:complete